jgi:hypothetical protein
MGEITVMTAASFEEAKSVVQCRHQSAIAEAQRIYRETVAQIEADHKRFHDAYRQQHELVKSDPDYDLTVIYEQLAIPVDLEPARHTLAEDVTKADRALHAELRALASQHGVQIFTGAYPTD